MYSLSDNSSLGRTYEIYNILYFRCDGQLFLYLLNTLLNQSFGVQQTVGSVNQLDQFVAESPSTQSYKVDSGISDGLFASNDIRRDVLAGPTSALYHNITTDLAELVEEYRSADDGIVVHCHLSGKLGGISDDDIVTKHTVVSHMHVFHQQVVAAYNSCAFRGCASGNGHILTDAVVVANFANRILTLKLQVLGLCGYAGSRKNLVAVANTRAIVDGDAVLEDVIVADYGVFVNITERTDHIVVA